MKWLRNFFDRLQLKLHAWGMHEIAMFVGRWGTPPAWSRRHDVEETKRTISKRESVLSLRRQAWSLVELTAGKLTVEDFDPERDQLVVFPQGRLDIN